MPVAQLKAWAHAIYAQSTTMPAVQVAYAKNPDYDRMGWVNDVIVHLWPHITSAASHTVRDMAEPLLQQNKPK